MEGRPPSSPVTTSIGIARVRGRASGLWALTAPTGLHGLTEDFAPLFGGDAFPAGFAALFAAFQPALPAKRHRMWVFLLWCHSSVIVACVKQILNRLDLKESVLV